MKNTEECIDNLNLIQLRELLKDQHYLMLQQENRLEQYERHIGLMEWYIKQFTIMEAEGEMIVVKHDIPLNMIWDYE